jgi:hypothetical protein
MVWFGTCGLVGKLRRAMDCIWLNGKKGICYLVFTLYLLSIQVLLFKTQDSVKYEIYVFFKSIFCFVFKV